MGDEDIRTIIARHVAEHGVAPTARLLGVGRDGVTTYLAGRARAGTTLMIETRATMVGLTTSEERGER